MRIALAIALALVPALGRAVEDPDTEVARRHFMQGREFYEAQQYRAALNEFLLARRVKAAPGLDFNIARCYDRLEDYASAVDYYERYVASGPADAAEVRARVLLLKERLAEDKPKAREPAPVVTAPLLLQPTPEAPKVDEAAARRRKLGIAVGVTVGVLVVGAAVAVGLVFGLRAEPHSPHDLGPFTATR